MINLNAIETRSCYINKVSNHDSILRVEKKLGVDLIPEDFDENDKIYKELLENNEGKFLIVYQVDCASDPTLMKKATSVNRSIKKKAEAMIIKNLANRIEANYYIKNIKPQHPVAVFTSEREGVEWLKSVS